MSARFATRLLLTAIGWSCLTGIAAAAPPTVTGSQWSQLDQGQILVTVGPDWHGVRLYEVMGLLDAPVERTWRMLLDIDHYTTVFSAVSQSYVKQRLTPTHLHHYEALRLPWPLVSRWFVNDVNLHPESHSYDWTNLTGNVKEQRGAFYCFPRGNRTLLVYQLYFDPDAPWFPKFLLNIGQRITLPSVIKDTRRAVARY